MAKKAISQKDSVPPVLELAGVSRTYTEGARNLTVLHDVSLTVRAGESVAIIGPSGSGKSTLLHVAGLLDTPTTGTVAVSGVPTVGLNDDALSAVRSQTMGFVYQFHHLLREFTALENVLVPYQIAPQPGMTATEAEARAVALLTAVGMQHRLHHLPGELSGGEQQRVAIARALMNKPALLLADEPTGNLDPRTADDVVDMLFGLVKTEGLAMLIVTHNPALAARCTYMYSMDNGHLAAA